MALHNVSPVREQLRGEMLAALARGRLTTADLYHLCPSADDPAEIARIAYELKKKGLVADGGKVLHPLGMRVNSYVLASPEDPRIEAAKPIVVERQIPRTSKPKKPAVGHPFQSPISPKAPQERRERITRDLPIHLTTPAPQQAAEPIHKPYHEPAMSENPMPYITDPDAFSLEPKEPEAEEHLDSDLVDALLDLAHLDLAHLEPKDAAVDDVLAMAAADVGEIAAAMGQRHDGKITDGVRQSQELGPEIFLPNEEPKKICQCLRITTLPALPEAYQYGGLKVWIDARHEVGRLTLATLDDGGGPFLTLKAHGRLAFDAGDLAQIARVGEALIQLHQSMDDPS